MHDEIPGWFDFQEFYDRMVREAPDECAIAEIGCFCGKSTCYLGEAIKQSGKKITVSAVDIWPTNVDGQNPDGLIVSTFETFNANIRARGLENIVTELIRNDSSKSAALFKDRSLFLAFIDADHAYESVRRDILAWLPKVSRGGYLAGHDYEHAHPGVMRAVDEIFGKRPSFLRSVWSVAL